MRPGLLVLVVLMVACTRPNPAFGDDPQGTSSANTSLTSGPDDGVDGPVSSTGGSGTSNEADSVSVDSSATGSEGTTGPMVGSTGECVEAGVTLVPTADAFIEFGVGACDGALDCHTLNFGASPAGLVHNVEGSEFRSFLLLSFDLASMPLPADPLSATLTLILTNEGEVGLEALQVFPTAWTEGGGVGLIAAEDGEATWQASSQPADWTTPVTSGTFEVVVEGAVGLGETIVPAAVGSHSVSIVLDPSLIGHWNDEPGVIHLVVTKVIGAGEAIAFTTESMADPPSLTITGC